jgi:hypothetical protein
VKTGSILTIVAAVAVVVVAAILASGGGDDAKPGSTDRAAVAPAGAHQLSFVVSPEKEELLKARWRGSTARTPRSAASACSCR